jgi:hypothetical protein
LLDKQPAIALVGWVGSSARAWLAPEEDPGAAELPGRLRELLAGPLESDWERLLALTGLLASGAATRAEAETWRGLLLRGLSAPRRFARRGSSLPGQFGFPAWMSPELAREARDALPGLLADSGLDFAGPEREWLKPEWFGVPDAGPKEPAYLFSCPPWQFWVRAIPILDPEEKEPELWKWRKELETRFAAG